jgi:hypothetical protein
MGRCKDDAGRNREVANIIPSSLTDSRVIIEFNIIMFMFLKSGNENDTYNLLTEQIVIAPLASTSNIRMWPLEDSVDVFTSLIPVYQRSCLGFLAQLWAALTPS